MSDYQFAFKLTDQRRYVIRLDWAALLERQRVRRVNAEIRRRMER